ncbi:glycosyl hydrolase-related protein [Bacillus sp. OVS6]|nr:glycosyl hydrolase-related protein [Bacillus sp. OVS6]
MAEEGDHVVTRWFNTSDEKADLKVNMPLVKQGFASNIIEEKLEVLQSNNIEIDLKPFEIKTVAWTH